MAISIRLDAAGRPDRLHLILATRSGNHIRELPISNVRFSDTLTNGSEMSFNVYRENCVDASGAFDEAFWKKITNLKLVYCPEIDLWYQLSVGVTETDADVKSCIATSLGEAELSQVLVYGIEVNTEEDIERDDYEPTVLYDPDHPAKSLIDRLLYKAPHYRVVHVDGSIMNIQRTFKFDGKSVRDCYSEIAQEIGCLFVYECKKTSNATIDRLISVYDLENTCNNCKARGDFRGQCEQCGSTDISYGYGDDTKIFVSTDNLAQEIRYETNLDAVKNCFRLEAGDDLMTATVVNANPNGSQYVWYTPDWMLDDMSEALQAKLTDYNTLYQRYMNTESYSPPSAIRSAYNTIVERYVGYKPELNTIPESITGYAALMNAYYDTIDLQLFLESELMPTATTTSTNAATELAKLTANNLSPIAVADLASCVKTTADSAVLGMAKCLVRGTYQVKVSSSAYNTSSHVWSGKLTVTNYGDETDTATHSSNISITINGDLETYIKQKINRMINQTESDPTDISALFKISNITTFANELKKYCRARLVAFRDACQAALDILIQQGAGVTSSSMYTSLYTPYRNKMAKIEAELSTREGEIATVAGTYDEMGALLTSGMQNVLAARRNSIQTVLNFENYLGETLWKEFAGYRREDTYKNQNYISDGLDNAQLFEMARTFYNNAVREIYKSAVLQHTITASIYNLLVMKEFQPLVDVFKLGNWIRVEADSRVWRLRLAEYTIDYDSWDLTVTFTDVREGYSAASDIADILNMARSMSSSYGAVAKQAENGNDGASLLNDWVERGLSLTTRIVGGAQNQEFSWDETGFTGRELIPETGAYSPEQVKIISHGIYMTTDNWQTAKAGLGRFRFWNPHANPPREEDAFGVIADKLVGNLILTEEIGIYNQNNTVVVDKNGVNIVSSASGNTSVFTVRKKSGNSYSNVLSLDTSGNLVLGGDGIVGTLKADQVEITDLNASNITTGTLSADRIAAHSLNVDKITGNLTGKGYSSDSASWKIDFQNGTLTIGHITADNITAGTLNVDRIAGNSIDATTKLKGEYTGKGYASDSASWKIDFKNGTLTIGHITADNITAGTLSADRIASHSLSADKIQGGTLTLGGANNSGGVLVIKNAAGEQIGKWDNGGITMKGTLTIGSSTISADTLRSGANSGYSWHNSIYTSNTTYENYALDGAGYGYGYYGATTETGGYPEYFRAGRLVAWSALYVPRSDTGIHNASYLKKTTLVTDVSGGGFTVQSYKYAKAASGDGSVAVPQMSSNPAEADTTDYYLVRE